MTVERCAKGIKMDSYDVIVIGGGPAGIVTAIAAKRRGKNVLLLEKMPKLGKKLLITGAGRCNLLNDKLDISFYKPEARPLVGSVLEKFGKEKVLAFLKELGLYVYADETGRIFPVTNQASSVLKALEMELERLNVPVELSCEIKGVEKKDGGFAVAIRNGQRVMSSKVILCGGGRSYPALGADGNAYHLAKKFGHSIVEPVPSTVPLLVKDPWCHFLQGQKVQAVVRVLQNGKTVKETSGDVLFTQYGLSGTAVLDISDPVSIALNREGKKEITISADLLPFLTVEELNREMQRKMKAGILPENILEGLLPHKFSRVLKEYLTPHKIFELSGVLKQKHFKVHGTRGWNEAEFTAGGVPTEEVDRDLQSKFQKGLYLAGEILDIQAARGGYSLAWAWSSGAVTGSSV